MAASVARVALPRFARAVTGRAKAQVRAMSSVVELSSYLVSAPASRDPIPSARHLERLRGRSKSREGHVIERNPRDLKTSG